MTGAGFFGSLDYLWSNPNNWAELSAPQPGEQGVQLVFPNSGAPRRNGHERPFGRTADQRRHDAVH